MYTHVHGFSVYACVGMNPMHVCENMGMKPHVCVCCAYKSVWGCWRVCVCVCVYMW